MSGKENYSVLEQHPFGTLNNMNSTPTKASGTTRVIDQLHSEIDELKRSLETSQSKVKEYKQKYDVVTKRSTQIIENLTNTKHENDMMNSMLARKERRIKDLEEELTESLSRADSMEFDQKSKEARLQKFQENENRLVGENEVLKMSYDALVRSQKEYKAYYEKEISYLKSNFEKHLKEREITLKENIDKFNSNDIELVEAFKKMTNKSSKLEELYKQKNNAIVEALKTLALAARDHGTKTIKVLNECEDILKAANRKLPTFNDDEVEETVKATDDVIIGENQENVAGDHKFEKDDIVSDSPLHESSQQHFPDKESSPESQASVAKDDDQLSTPEPPDSLTLPTNFPQSSKDSRIHVVKRGHSRASSVNITSPTDNNNNNNNSNNRSSNRRSLSAINGPSVAQFEELPPRDFSSLLHQTQPQNQNQIRTQNQNNNQILQRRTSNRRSSYQRKPSNNINNSNNNNNNNSSGNVDNNQGKRNSRAFISPTETQLENQPSNSDAFPETNNENVPFTDRDSFNDVDNSNEINGSGNRNRINNNNNNNRRRGSNRRKPNNTNNGNNARNRTNAV